jgi:hypothetical protein
MFMSQNTRRVIGQHTGKYQKFTPSCPCHVQKQCLNANNYCLKTNPSITQPKTSITKELLIANISSLFLNLRYVDFNPLAADFTHIALPCRIASGFHGLANHLPWYKHIRRAGSQKS